MDFFERLLYILQDPNYMHIHHTIPNQDPRPKCRITTKIISLVSFFMFANRGDTDYFSEQAVASKRFKLDPNESPAKRNGKFEGTTFALPREHRQDLTVGEIWKEKKNIVIVGNAESSFILYCTRVPGTCNIFNTRTMSLVLLEPGNGKVLTDSISDMYNSGLFHLVREMCA